MNDNIALLHKMSVNELEMNSKKYPIKHVKDDMDTNHKCRHMEGFVRNVHRQKIIIYLRGPDNIIRKQSGSNPCLCVRICPHDPPRWACGCATMSDRCQRTDWISWHWGTTSWDSDDDMTSLHCSLWSGFFSSLPRVFVRHKSMPYKLMEFC